MYIDVQKLADPGSMQKAAAMRLCVYTKFWRRSGTGLFAQELVESLIEAGAAVTFISPEIGVDSLDLDRPGLIRIKQPRELVGPEPRVARIFSSLARITASATALLRARRHHRTFIFSIPEPLFFTLPLMLLLRLSGARIIFVAHDPVPHAWRLPRLMRVLELGGHALSYRLANRVVVLSSPSASKIQAAFGVPIEKVRVIQHGAFDLGTPIPPPDTGSFLCFGTIRRNKGTLEAIAGAISARDAGYPVKLVVAGEAHKQDLSYARTCAALAARAPGTVDFREGYVPDNDLPALVAATDAFLMPYSTFFSQSGVAMVAASNARPIVAAAAGGIATLLAEGMPGVVIEAPLSGARVAAALIGFLGTRSNDWYQRSLAFRLTTLDSHSWASIAADYIQLAEGLG